MRTVIVNEIAITEIKITETLHKIKVQSKEIEKK